MTKAELRRDAAKRRQGMPDEVRAKASALIAQRLFSLKEWKMAETVFLYCGCKDEVNTDEDHYHFPIKIELFHNNLELMLNAMVFFYYWNKHL